MDLDALPGGDLIARGLADQVAGRDSAEALLVEIGAPRLRRLGIPARTREGVAAEHRLYDLLAETNPDSAHSRYNALIRRLVSFERAAECVAA